VDVNVDMGFYRFISMSMRHSCCVYTDRRFFFFLNGRHFPAHDFHVKGMPKLKNA
jgi:hypothetical protein